MHCLNNTMPRIFMRMHDIKTFASPPPRAGGKPQLIDPPGFAQWHGNLVISDARPLMGYFLCEHMNIMLSSQLLDQRN